MQECVCFFTSDYYEEVFGMSPPDDLLIGFYANEDNTPVAPAQSAYVNSTIEVNAKIILALDEVCGHW